MTVGIRRFLYSDEYIRAGVRTKVGMQAHTAGAVILHLAFKIFSGPVIFDQNRRLMLKPYFISFILKCIHVVPDSKRHF